MFNNKFLLYIAQADAYCLPTKFVKNAPKDFWDRFLKFDKYQHKSNKIYTNNNFGKYSDNTILSYAVAETLLEDTYTKDKFADSFVRCFNYNKRKAFPKKLQDLLEASKAGPDLISNMKELSTSNEAVTRAISLGMIKDIGEMLDATELQASITNYDNGVSASLIIALVSHYHIYNLGPTDKHSLLEFIFEYFDGIGFLKYKWEGPVIGPNLGMNTAHAVIDILTSSNDMLEILKKAIMLTGDANTVAATACGIASFKYEQELPSFFLKDLEIENINYGINYLLNLGTGLCYKFKHLP